MTVMCKPFFAIPQTAIRLGKLKHLSGFATKLYAALWYEAERYSTRELTRTVAQLRVLIGGAPNSHAKGRAELVQANLLVAEAFGPDGFVFHLCNPETGKPWPLDPREPAPYERMGAASAPVPQGHAKSPPRSKMADAGTRFQFGANAAKSDASEADVLPLSQPLKWDELCMNDAQKMSTPTRKD